MSAREFRWDQKRSGGRRRKLFQVGCFISERLKWDFACSASLFHSHPKVKQKRNCFLLNAEKATSSFDSVLTRRVNVRNGVTLRLKTKKAVWRKRADWLLTDTFDQKVLCKARLWLDCTNRPLRFQCETPPAGCGFRILWSSCNSSIKCQYSLCNQPAAVLEIPSIPNC